ncbi:MAG: hypothetical protein ACYDCK_04695 [Thermoplasmatota archaeon]
MHIDARIVIVDRFILIVRVVRSCSAASIKSLRRPEQGRIGFSRVEQLG